MTTTLSIVMKLVLQLIVMAMATEKLGGFHIAVTTANNKSCRHCHSVNEPLV